MRIQKIRKSSTIVTHMQCQFFDCQIFTLIPLDMLSAWTEEKFPTTKHNGLSQPHTKGTFRFATTLNL